MADRVDTLVAVLEAALAEGPALSLAVLFGSSARGHAHADSDVDLAILPVDPELPLHAELVLQATLERACGRSVHLVRLDYASTVLKWEVARQGIMVFARSRRDQVRFVAQAALEHADLASTLARAGAVFRDRVQASVGRTEAR
ncbi:MAG: type VII toxin-antitoxin system MntA family adenylyltransferase antitoxin [Candidatus Binatia bacterium]